MPEISQSSSRDASTPKDAPDSHSGGSGSPKANQPQKRQPGFFSKLNKDATLTGVVKSTFSNLRNGADVVSTGLGSITESSRNIAFSGRIESFDNAMQRLCLADSDLPLIHNQIVLQTYLSFFIGLAAMTMAAMYVITTPFWGSGLLCGVVAITAFVYFVQSSSQALQIRERRLGLLGEFILSPSQWFPSRMANLRQMQKNDPLRLASVVEPMASIARKRMGMGLVFLTLSVLFKLTDWEMYTGPWGTLFLAFSLVFLLLGASLSFNVFRRRCALHCDVIPWLFSPSEWIPSAIDLRDLKSNANSVQSKVKVVTSAVNDEL